MLWLWLLQLLVAAPLAYVSYCTFFSLFKLGSSFSSLQSYHMVARATHSWSLLLNASLLCRFAAPLAFNYLHVIRMTGHQRGGRGMVFMSGVYSLQDVPLLGARFNTWFPLLLVVYVGILLTGVFERCLNWLSGFGGMGGLVATAREDNAEQDGSGACTRLGEERVKAEWIVRERGGGIGSDILEGSGSDVEMAGGMHKAPVQATSRFRYTYERLGNGGDVDSRPRDVDASEQQGDETDSLFSNIGRK